MKLTHSLFILAITVFYLPACKKNSQSPFISNSADIVGKWQETQLHIHETTSTGIITDTTYTANAFTGSDFAQFNSDYIALISRAGGSPAKPGEIRPDYIAISNYTYRIMGSSLMLTSTDAVIGPETGTESGVTVAPITELITQLIPVL